MVRVQTLLVMTVFAPVADTSPYPFAGEGDSAELSGETGCEAKLRVELRLHYPLQATLGSKLPSCAILSRKGRGARSATGAKAVLTVSA